MERTTFRTDRKATGYELRTAPLKMQGHPGRDVTFSIGIEEKDPIPVQTCSLKSLEWRGNAPEYLSLPAATLQVQPLQERSLVCSSVLC